MKTKTLNHKPGLVKGVRTSLYYGVRVQTDPSGSIYYRSSIMVQGKSYYLGCYTDEQLAAYAFNVAFDSMSNGKYEIKNKVNLSTDDKFDVLQRVSALLVKKGFMSPKYLE